MEKRQIRKEKLNARNCLDRSTISKNSERIAAAVFTTEEYRREDVIFLYASYGSEVLTDTIILKALNDHKHVKLPVSYIDEASKESRMDFYEIDSLDKLKSGYKGIREPDLDSFYFEKDNSDVGLMIMPGVAFDRRCHRIGYGKGFYDSYLSRYRKDYVMALAFECQMCDEIIETEAHDFVPDMVITEENIYFKIMQ